MSVDNDLLDAVENVLAGHDSKSEAIPAAEISQRVGITDGEASPKTREAIKNLLRERQVPVRSCNNGYYLLSDTAELEEYLENLDGRIAGIQERKQLIVAAFNQQQEAES